MRKVLYILVAAVVLCAACNKEDLRFAQHEAIVKYLTSIGLVAEENVGDVIEDNPQFYSTFGRYAYRYIPTYYDAGRESRAEVEWGNTIEIYFDAYVIENGKPTTIYWSNTEEMYRKFRSENPDFTVDWSTDPLRITLGETEILEGLNMTLPGCREKDSVQVFMTYDLAYGKKIVGTVPKNSAVAWYMKIDKVEK